MEPMDMQTEVVLIQNQLERILGHHEKFEESFEKLFDLVTDERTDRMNSIASIKDELHGRINAILFSILGGAGLFIAGIITWVVTTKGHG